MKTNNYIRIVVTDSGLGGLSVVEDILKKAKVIKKYSHIDLIFADALFDINSGYNKLKNKSLKIEIFNKALFGMEKNFKPDIILIACNTLSVLYHETEFSKKINFPVIEIVDFGVQEMYDFLIKNPDNKVIIFATETTISSNLHKQKLIQKGIKSEQVYNKACPNLQSIIEKNPYGKESNDAIDKYISEILNEIVDKNNLSISLNCTHFGYSMPLWEKNFSEKKIKLNGIFNPNNKMSEVIFSKSIENKHYTTVNLRVVSKVKMEKTNQMAMYELFKKETPELAYAIKNYELIADLF